jgi:hypothetical protein
MEKCSTNGRRGFAEPQIKQNSTSEASFPHSGGVQGSGMED